MQERFNSYLNGVFGKVKDTPEARVKKENALCKLNAKAEALKASGETDEDVIFQKSVASLGDFSSEINELAPKETVTNKILSFGMKVLIVLCAVLCVTAIYLGVSFGVKNIWDKSWLIMVVGIFAIIIIVALIYISKWIEKKPIRCRIFTLGIIVLISVSAYLCLEILTEAPNAWILFLLMVMLLLISETAMLYVMSSPIALGSLLLTVPVVATMVYVILSIMDIITWHPYWLIILGGVIVDVIILTISITQKLKKKK